MDPSDSKEIEDVYYSLLDLEGLPDDRTEPVRDEVLLENLDPVKKTNIDERATIFIHNSKYPKWIKMLCAHIVSPESRLHCLNKIIKASKENLHYDLTSHILDSEQLRPTPFKYFDKPYMPTKKIPTYFKKNRLPLLNIENDVYNTPQTLRESSPSLPTKSNEKTPVYGVFSHNDNESHNNNNNNDNESVKNNINMRPILNTNENLKINFKPGVLYVNNENVKDTYNPGVFYNKETNINSYNPGMQYDKNENFKNGYHSGYINNGYNKNMFNPEMYNNGVLYNNNEENDNYDTPAPDFIDPMFPPEIEEKQDMYSMPHTTEMYKVNLLPKYYQQNDNIYTDFTTQLTYTENATHVNSNYIFSKLNHVSDVKVNNRDDQITKDWKGITYYVKANRLKGLQHAVDCDIFKCVMKNPSIKLMKSKGDILELQCKCIKRKVYKKGGINRRSMKIPKYTVLVNNKKQNPEYTIQSEEVEDYINAIAQVENELVRTGAKFY